MSILALPLTREKLYLGNYRPVSMYQGDRKIAGWTWAEQSGTDIVFEDTYNDAVHGMINGHSEQNGTPSPSAPIPILSAGGCDLASQNADGGKSSSVAMPILRSLPNGVKDTLTYKGGGMWEHVQRVGVKVFDGTESWTLWESYGFYTWVLSAFLSRSSNAGLCTHFVCDGLKASPTNEGRYCYNAGGGVGNGTVTFKPTGFSGMSLANWTAFLAAQYAAGTPVTVQYELAEPITTMLSLGELKTYPHETQIHQDTTGLLADLTLTARVVDKEAE